VRLEGLGQLKKSNDLIRNRIRVLPACSIVPRNSEISTALKRPSSEDATACDAPSLVDTKHNALLREARLLVQQTAKPQR
jgi:hypothetical protein